MTTGRNVLADTADSETDATSVSSRRLSGAAWQPAMAIPNGEFAGTAVLPTPVRRSRRRRRRWYRRPVFLVPSALALLALGLAAGILLRAESTIAELQRVSTPPPSVALRDEETSPEVTIDKDR
jgi:hypothetical protein